MANLKSGIDRGSFSQLLPCVKHLLHHHLLGEESHLVQMQKSSPLWEGRRRRYLTREATVVMLLLSNKWIFKLPG